MENHYTSYLNVSVEILRALELAMKVPYGSLSEKCTGKASGLRISHRSPIPAADMERGDVSRVWPHTDLRLITLFFQDVREAWNEMVINVNEALERWTNGELPAGVHQVTVPPGLKGKDDSTLPSRFSSPIFFKADRIHGAILLGGWSLGWYLSVAMAHMLAQDRSTDITVAGLLLIDSPYHTLWAEKGDSYDEHSKPPMVNVPPLCKSPLYNDEDIQLTTRSGCFRVKRGTILYKPTTGNWIRRQTDEFRDDPLLGWEQSYLSFIKAVLELDSDHYGIFNKYNRKHMQHVTSQVKAALEILESLEVGRHRYGRFQALEYSSRKDLAAKFEELCAA
ncbi:hypothetical protein DL769_003695 [Monosporascus sp. CRB-8-3]|nr:hypothetical protein DL769_003695 [Monosporascus sp. CRB-8-3]